MANNELQIAGSQGELRIRPYEHHAKYYETDQMGIIHHSNYVKWMEEARLDLMDQIGLNYRQMEDMEIISPVLSISVEYHSMVHFDDTVVIYTKLLKYNGIKMELEYVMKDKETGELRTTAKSSHCFLNKSGKPISLKRMYPELDTKFLNLKRHNKMIQDRLKALRSEMAKRGISLYVVPTADFHESEYVGEHFKARKYITGFTGSAGTAVITMDEAGLWTDGRYFVQAAAQLKDTTVKLFKIGEEGVPTVDEYIKDTLSDGGVIGFDGRVVNAAWGKRLSEIAKEKHGSMYVNEDLIDLIWTDRPPMSKAPVMIFDNKYTGEDISSKLKRVREQMAQKGATLHLMSSLYDIAWLLNVRGGDISYVPVVLSYLALSQDSCIWFLQEEVVTETLKAYLDKNGIQTRPYDDFYEYVKHIDEKETVLLNTSIVNYRICDSLPDGVKVIDAEDPTVVMKAVKNEVQLENLRKAHLKDAVAMCKFMYWLKTNIGKISMTEISASDYLASLRAEQEGFLDLSFATICGYADHGAIVHYSATEESDRQLKPESLLLVDSGGHYLEGTTDITRTFALGPVTDEMKDMFTRVCRSNMNLANAKFKEGCSGLNFDILAREPFWEIGMDYNHGTGHGVGYVLNVHEGPNSFHWKQYPGRTAERVIEEGMVTTDEPGIYLEGKFGIRTENELICRKGEKNEYGQFMYFENLTYVPIDLDAIDPNQMTDREKGYLNAYHARVYELVSPFLNDEEAQWLKKYTRAI